MSIDTVNPDSVADNILKPSYVELVNENIKKLEANQKRLEKELLDMKNKEKIMTKAKK